MKLKNIIRTISCAGLLLASTTSCSDWLDVAMSDKVMENTLFDTNKGYLTALNGIYLEMNDLYVDKLTAGNLDVMAQYYNVTKNYSHVKAVYANYEFQDASFEAYSDAIWAGAYRLIANTNVILEHCDAADAAINDTYYPIVKGEALALRALLHFDMLRLYGPIYNEENASKECIPYHKSSSKDIQPLLPASEVLAHVIKDLEDAAELLKDADPIITEGVQNNTQNDNGLDNNNLNYRQLRLNYYAVKALLARAHSWGGDKTKAYEIAKNDIIDKITTEELQVFPWSTEEEVHAEGKADRIFSSEVFFALYKNNLSNLYTNLFSSALDAKTGRLAFVGSNYGNSKVANFYDDENDWRRGFWEITGSNEDDDEEEGEEGEEGEESEEGSTLYLTKFKEFAYDAETDGTELYRYMMPLVRLSEVYLLAAEGAPTKEEAFQYINTLRLHRNCRDVAADVDLQETITAEFAREVIGEGQLFYYYKRHAMEHIMSGTAINGTYTMDLGYYVLPLPPSEADKRVM